MELDRTEPLYIIELGTGSGKFSFFMLKALLEMKVRNWKLARYGVRCAVVHVDSVGFRQQSLAFIS